MVPAGMLRPHKGVMLPIYACINLVSGPELACSHPLGGSYIRTEEEAQSETSSVCLCHDHGFGCFSVPAKKKESGHWMSSLPTAKSPLSPKGGYD